MNTLATRAAALLLALAAVTATRAEPYAMGAGTEGRHWLPERAPVDNPALRYPVTIRDGVTVTARDGVKLDARLFLPTLKDGAKPTPCVLMSDGYGRTSNTGAETDPVLMNVASRGYAVLHLSPRGSGASGGEATLYDDFGQDGADAVEWMAGQSWCDGNVGMVGPSLLGIAQWLTAKEAPPHLKAIVPQVACGDCYGLLWYPGGMMPGPGREARKLSPGAGREYPSALAHRDLDDWWRARTTLDADVKAIAARGVAAFISGGLDDVAPDGTSTQIVQGYLNVPHAGSESDPLPLVPGQARRVDLDLLPTAMVFQPGHRIRLALAGAASVAPGLPAPQGPGPSPAAFTWTVLQDEAHPATLTLPVVGTAGDQLARLGPARR